VLIFVIPPFLAALTILDLPSATGGKQSTLVAVDLPTLLPIGFDVTAIGVVSPHEAKNKTINNKQSTSLILFMITRIMPYSYGFSDSPRFYSGF